MPNTTNRSVVDVDGMTPSEVSLALLSSPSWSELLMIADPVAATIEVSTNSEGSPQRSRESISVLTSSGAGDRGSSGDIVGSREQRGIGPGVYRLTAAQKLLAQHSPLGF